MTSRRPAITVLLCTVRPDAGYLEYPEWTTLGKVLDDLSAQTFKDFELIVVDGLFGMRNPLAEFSDEVKARGRITVDVKGVETTLLRPRDTLWTRNKKVAISAYRNTGLTHARGELVVNLDDCCELPPTYLETFHYAWTHHRTCLGMLWPDQGDVRRPGRVTAPGQVYGFGSYPLDTAIHLNGYDEAYDGAQGLEDADWSHRGTTHGISMALAAVPGFKICQQSPHDPRAIDAERPIVRCCNTTWHVQRTLRRVQVANKAELWHRDWVRWLIGPCMMMEEKGRCGFHRDGRVCAYINSGFATEVDPLAARLFEEPPVFDLGKARQEAGVDP